MSGTVAISWGEWGGVYWHWGHTVRLCLGYVAVTYFPNDLDSYLESNDTDQ